MPAAAVIPAPIAYINVVAVKKLVVGFLARAIGAAPQGVVSFWSAFAILGSGQSWASLFGVGPAVVYCEQIRVFKARMYLNTLAWNNKIGLWWFSFDILLVCTPK